MSLPKPLGNIYPLVNGKFIISCFNGLYIYDRKRNSLKHYLDVRQKNELKDISYNDGTISRNKFWIGLCHIKETDDLGYFGYILDIVGYIFGVCLIYFERETRNPQKARVSRVSLLMLPQCTLIVKEK